MPTQQRRGLRPSTTPVRGSVATSELSAYQNQSIDRPATASSSIPGDDEPITCCVCLEQTDVFTACKHPLCCECKGKLIADACPLCRRPLQQQSWGDVPTAMDSEPEAARSNSMTSSSFRTTAFATFATQAFASAPLMGSDRGSEDLRLEGSAAASSADGTRRRSTIQLQHRQRQQQRTPRGGPSSRLLLRCEMGRFQRLLDALVCAEELQAFLPAELRRRVLPVPYRTQRESLSESVAELIRSTQFSEVVAVARRLHNVMNRRALLPELVLPAIRDKLRSAAREGPAIREFAWSDVNALVAGLNRFRELEMFHPFVEALARLVAQHTVAAVRLTVMTRPAEFCTNHSLLDSWPAAHAAFQEARDDMRSLVKQGLLEAATRFSTARASAPSSPRSSSLNRIIEVMTVASYCGLLDHDAAVVVCDALAPGFVRDGVKTVGTLKWTHKESGPVVARQLATHMTKQPEFVCYNIEGRMLFFDHRSPYLTPQTA